jgi:hypothetical protein
VREVSLRLRLPDRLHHEVTASAERDGASLNQWIVAAVARELGRREAGNSRRGWVVYSEDGGWAAEHQFKRGLVAGAYSWEELFWKMADAEEAWDSALAAS